MKNLRQLVRRGSTLLASLPGDCQPVSPTLPLLYSHVPADLTSTQMSYLTPAAPATCNMLSYFLTRQSTNPPRDRQNLFVGSQVPSLLIVCLGRAAAGVARPPLWRLFQSGPCQKITQRRNLWKREPLSDSLVMGRRDMVVRNAKDFEQAVHPNEGSK
jgi:hypothetical protein